MSIAVGIIITALISWIVAVFGMAVFQTYERYDSLFTCLIPKLLSLTADRWAGIPQLVVLLVLVGIAGKQFDISSQSSGGAATITAGRLSFFTLSLSAPVSWAGAGSDYYVYVS